MKRLSSSEKRCSPSKPVRSLPGADAPAKRSLVQTLATSRPMTQRGIDGNLAPTRIFPRPVHENLTSDPCAVICKCKLDIFTSALRRIRQATLHASTAVAKVCPVALTRGREPVQKTLRPTLLRSQDARRGSCPNRVYGLRPARSYRMALPCIVRSPCRPRGSTAPSADRSTIISFRMVASGGVRSATTPEWRPRGVHRFGGIAT